MKVIIIYIDYKFILVRFFRSRLQQNKIRQEYTQLSINKDSLSTGWIILKTAIILWPIVSLPFILFFGLSGDDPKTAFSKSLAAAAITIAVILAVIFLIRYAINRVSRSKTD